MPPLTLGRSIRKVKSCSESCPAPKKTPPVRLALRCSNPIPLRHCWAIHAWTGSLSGLEKATPGTRRDSESCPTSSSLRSFTARPPSQPSFLRLSLSLPHSLYTIQRQTIPTDSLPRLNTRAFSYSFARPLFNTTFRPQTFALQPFPNLLRSSLRTYRTLHPTR